MNPVEDLINKAHAWWERVEQLNNTRVGPSLIGKKAELLTRAKSIRNKLEAIPGLKPLLDFPPTNIAGLGLPIVLPVIAAATIASAVVWIKNWDNDNAKMEIAVNLTRSGASAEEIQKTIDSINSGGVLGGASKALEDATGLLKWALIGFAAIKFLG